MYGRPQLNNQFNNAEIAHYTATFARPDLGIQDLINKQDQLQHRAVFIPRDVYETIFTSDHINTLIEGLQTEIDPADIAILHADPELSNDTHVAFSVPVDAVCLRAVTSDVKGTGPGTDLLDTLKDVNKANGGGKYDFDLLRLHVAINRNPTPEWPTPYIILV